MTVGGGDGRQGACHLANVVVTEDGTVAQAQHTGERCVLGRGVRLAAGVRPHPLHGNEPLNH